VEPAAGGGLDRGGAVPVGWAVVEGPGSTGELRGTRSRGWLGSRESGGRGSAAAYGGAATRRRGEVSGRLKRTKGEEGGGLGAGGARH
jgi:hypothetical protein